MIYCIYCRYKTFFNQVCDSEVSPLHFTRLKFPQTDAFLRHIFPENVSCCVAAWLYRKHANNKGLNYKPSCADDQKGSKDNTPGSLGFTEPYTSISNPIFLKGKYLPTRNRKVSGQKTGPSAGPGRCCHTNKATPPGTTFVRPPQNMSTKELQNIAQLSIV